MIPMICAASRPNTPRSALATGTLDAGDRGPVAYYRGKHAQRPGLPTRSGGRDRGTASEPPGETGQRLRPNSENPPGAGCWGYRRRAPPRVPNARAPR